MPLVSLKTQADWVNSSVDPNVSWDIDGNGFLTPKSFWPNQYATEFSDNGEAKGWALRAGMAEKVVGHHVNVSRPGQPNKTSVTRQTTSFLPVTEAKWKADGPIIPGARSKGTDKRKLPAPNVEVSPVTTRGFTGGRYAYAWGTSDKNGRPTTTTDWCYFTLANNQRPIIPIPDSFNEGSVYWDIYLTKVNGGPASAALQRKVPISQIAGLDEYLLTGPWQNRGPVPTRNLSGVGTTPAPVVGRDARVAPAIPAFDLKAGFWTLFYQLKNARGPGLLSPASRTIPVKGTRERRVKEPSAGAFAEPSERNAPAAFSSGDRPDPRNIRPSGKLPGNEYLGQENDYEESRLVALLNERRRAAGVPNLVVSQVMNRAAYAGVLKSFDGADALYSTTLARAEGYEGQRTDSGYVVTHEDSADLALEELEGSGFLSDALARSVGVAREKDGAGLHHWYVVVGEPITDPSYDAATELVCEHVADDGTVSRHAVGDVHADVSISFDLVARFEDGSYAMRCSYGGSYPVAVDTAISRTHALDRVTVRLQSGGDIENAISDGSLASGVMATTYSSGRTVLNSYYYSRATQNARNACTIHELFHGLGFGHVTTPSVLNTPCRYQRTDNHEYPTSYDVSEYKRVYPPRATPSPKPPPPSSSPPPPSSSPPPASTPPPPPARPAPPPSSPPKPSPVPRPGAPGTPPSSTPPPTPTPESGTPPPREPAEPEGAVFSRKSPYPGMMTSDRTPRISVLVTDPDGVLTKSNIRLFFDKRETTNFSYANRFLTFDAPMLMGGSHSVAVAVTDAQGQIVEESWSFEVEVPVEYEFVPGDYMDGHGIHVRVPRAAFHPDVDYAPWLRYEPPVGSEGGVEFYRAYLRRDPAGSARYFYGTEKPPVIHGYPPEKEPTGLRIGLVAENPPLVDESVVEAPDPEGVPDAPTPTGTPTPPAGTYLVTVHGVLESGKLTQESEPTRIAINGTSETFSVSPVKTVNLLPNAELSQLDASGKPEDWTPISCAPEDTPTTLPALYSIKDGVTTIRTLASTTANPVFESTRMPVSQESIRNFSGELLATQVIEGSAFVVVREYDPTGVIVRDTVLARLDVAGAVPFSKAFGPGGQAWHPDAVSHSLRPGMTGATVHLTMQFRDLAAFPFPSDLRKVEFASPGSGEPDSFDVAASRAHGTASFVAYGPAPTPAGADLPEPVLPVEVVNFENGLLPSGWAVNGGNPATSSVDAAAAIHNSFGLNLRDTSAGARTYWLSKSYPGMDGKTFALRELIRIPQRPTVGFVNVLGVMNRPGTLSLASLRYHANGSLEFVWNYPRKGTSATKYVMGGVTSGSLLDAEFVLTGGTTKNGFVSLSVGLNGAPRSRLYAVGSIDYTGVFIGTALVGVNFASDSRMNWHFHFDQIVVTPNGDILNRERPPAPSGYVPPPPDRPRRPLTAWSPKTLYAAMDERVPALFGGLGYNGHAYRATPGTSGPTRPAFPVGATQTVRDNAGLVTVARTSTYALGSSVLKPGGASTDAEWYEVTGLTTAATSATTAATPPAYPVLEGQTVTDGTAVLTARKTVVWTEAGASYREFEPDEKRLGQAYIFIAPGEGPVTLDLLKRPIAVKPGMSYTDGLFSRRVIFGDAAPGVRVWLEGDGVEPVLAASFGEMAASRSWHGAGDEDDFVTYAVPEAKRDDRGALLPFYSRVRYEAVLTEGVYVFQEPLHAQGLHPSPASRNVMRGYGRALSGELSVDLPTHAPAFRARGALAPETYWSDFGTTLARDIDASESLDDGVEVLFSTSHDGVDYSFETDDKSLVNPEAFLRQRIGLTGNGRDGPVIPAGGVHLRTWHDQAVLLRRDGSHFPGIATIPNVLWTEESPDARFDSVGGRVYVVELTEAVERMGGITIQVATERALKEITAMSARGEAFQAEIPGAEDLVGGISYELKLGEKANFDAYDVPPALLDDDARGLWAVAEIGDAEVVEGAPLKGPMESRGTA